MSEKRISLPINVPTANRTFPIPKTPAARITSLVGIGGGMTEIFYPGQMGEGRLRSQVGYLDFFLRQAAAGDDFVENGGQGLFRKDSLVFLEQPFEYFTFPFGIPFGPAGGILQLADFFGTVNPFFEKIEDCVVNCVYFVAYIENFG